MRQMLLFSQDELLSSAQSLGQFARLASTPRASAVDSEMDGLLATAALEPRTYQRRLIGKVCEMYSGEYVNEDGERERRAQSVMVESPTGSGKTIIGLCVARLMQQLHGYHCCWIAMRRNLLAQAANENADRKIGANVDFLSLFEKSPPPELLQRGQRPLLLIVDEAQHDAVNSAARLHHLLRPERVLGLTATPYRTDRLKLIFERVVKDLGIKELIDGGYLSRYRHFTIPKWDPTSVADVYGAEPERWGKSLLFFLRHSECRSCQQRLSELGISSEIVTANSDRERQLEDFEHDRIRVLISMRVLTEGFDCPSLKTVFCRPSGKLCVTQMAGRVFRIDSQVGLKQLVQCEETRYPFTRTATPDEQYVWTDSGWRSLQTNPRIAEISKRCLQAIAQAQVSQLPHYMTKQSKKNRAARATENEDRDTRRRHTFISPF